MTNNSAFLTHHFYFFRIFVASKPNYYQISNNHQ